MVDMASFSMEAWGRLGEKIRRRRTALRMKQSDLANVAGVSVNTIVNIEKGNRARELTLPAICRALGWTEGSAILILEGGDPVVEEAAQEPADDDTFRVERPDGVSDREWAEITEKLEADIQFWLRQRRGR